MNQKQELVSMKLMGRSGIYTQFFWTPEPMFFILKDTT